MNETPPPSLNKTLGVYVPLELKPFTGRPGAMDAFKLPSLYNGVAVPRNQRLPVHTAYSSKTKEH